MALDYLCYISRTKIDQLYSQLSPGDTGETKETRSIASEAKSSAGISFPALLAVLRGDFSYGRSDVLQTERQLKKSYVEKLKEVMAKLAANGQVKSLDQTSAENILASTYFSYEGEFRIDQPLELNGYDAGLIVTLKARWRDYDIHFDCSLRNFSEGSTGDGSFHIHSGNSAFFTGKVSLNLESVAILLGHKQNVIFASPLFLVLRVPKASAMHPGSQQAFI